MIKKLYCLCVEMICRAEIRVPNGKIPEDDMDAIIEQRFRNVQFELLRRVEMNYATYADGWVQKLSADQKDFHATTYDWFTLENTLFCTVCGKYNKKQHIIECFGDIKKYKRHVQQCSNCLQNVANQ